MLRKSMQKLKNNVFMLNNGMRSVIKAIHQGCRQGRGSCLFPRGLLSQETKNLGKEAL